VPENHAPLALVHEPFIVVVLGSLLVLGVFNPKNRIVSSEQQHGHAGSRMRLCSFYVSARFLF
jgi:hypothetical protein